MPSYESLKNRQAELIRKSLDGSAFLAPASAAAIATLTSNIAAVVGPPAVPAHNELTALPADWDDLGWLTDDGMSFSREVTSSEVTSFGSVTPTRTDVTSDSTSITINCQETKLLTIGLATGADLSGSTPTALTGEVKIIKPARASGRTYRLLGVAVDETDDGEIFIARFFPRAKVSSYAEQSFAKSDDPITWGVTFSGEEDSVLGYSEAWFFGGDGWEAQLNDMGWTYP